MLKKKERLTKREFDRFFSSGKRVHSPVLQLIYTPHESFHGAVVVGKKVHKRAVDRNKLRRRLYSVLYRYQKTEGRSGVFICIAKPPAKEMTFTELKNEMETLLGRVSNPG